MIIIKIHMINRVLILTSISVFISMMTACGKDVVGIRTHYDNPFAESKKGYVNPKWAEQARADGGEAIANESSAIWLNRTWDVAAFEGDEPFAGMGLEDHLDTALVQQADLITLVLYNLPDKGCSLFGNIMQDLRDMYGYSGARGMTIYKEEYIDKIVSILSRDEYAGISIVAIVEPDSLINQTNNPQVPGCLLTSNSQTSSFTEGVRYALEQFKALKNIHSYIPVGNASVLGREDNFRFASMYVKGVLTGFDDLAVQMKAWEDMVELSDSWTGEFTGIGNAFSKPVGETLPPGWGSINGFVTNVASYVPLEEPYLAASSDHPQGSTQDATFYDGGLIFGELEYSQKWLNVMRDYGADKNLGMLIDTSRNGWGGPSRGSAQSEAAPFEQQVNEASLRVDRRPHRRSYCNQEGAGIGERPQANPKEYIDAYIWAKSVGESDGLSKQSFSVVPTDIIRYSNEMCHPHGYNEFAENSVETKGLGIGTGAMPDAPRNRMWFPYAFKQLLQNAYPPIENTSIDSIPIDKSSK